MNYNSEKISSFFTLIDEVVDLYKKYTDISQGIQSVKSDKYIRVEENEYLGKEINNFILKGIPEKTITEIRLLSPEENDKFNLVSQILSKFDINIEEFIDYNQDIVESNTFLISKTETIREYDYKSVIYVLKKETQIESKLMLKTPNFDKNFLVETEAIPNFVYYELPFISYTTLIHLLAYRIVKDFTFSELMVLTFLAKSPYSIIQSKAQELENLYQEYKKRKLKTNILNAVISTLNKSVNPQITLQELIKYLLYGEQTEEFTDFENAYNKAKDIITSIGTFIELKETRRKIITYTPAGEYTIKKINLVSLTNHGTTYVCNNETSIIPTKNIIKSVAFLKSQTKAVNGRIILITKKDGKFVPLDKTDLTSENLEYYESVENISTFKSNVEYLPPQFTMSVSIPSANWNDVIKYSQFNLAKLYVNRQSLTIQTPYDDGFIDVIVSLSPNVSFNYNCLTEKLQVNWTNYFTTKTL